MYILHIIADRLYIINIDIGINCLRMQLCRENKNFIPLCLHLIYFTFVFLTILDLHNSRQNEKKLRKAN